MTDAPRLIEVSFPLKQASLDSVHEKNVRHGHISTLHIWPARRPLAASRAALIATLLPDPGSPEERKNLLEKIGGRVISRTERKKVNGKTIEVKREETEGGVLHWGHEENPDMELLRAAIRKAYGDRAPRVLDPFAGGGAIPLEAMRLGCETTAIDINPVAWFLLKCTLDYPQRLAGKKLPLPEFALQSTEFMAEFQKGSGKTVGKRKKARAGQTGMFEAPEVGLPWLVRAWGSWVLRRVTDDLNRFYPVIDGRPTVAYLWARTVRCKNCRCVVPLLKTRWLCKKEGKRIALTMATNEERTGVVFGIDQHVPVVGGNAAQRREADKRAGQGTMTRSGVSCPCCPVILTSDDLRHEAQAGRLGAIMTSVVVSDRAGKAYRLPTDLEKTAAEEATAAALDLFQQIPYGIPNESVPRGGSRAGGGSPFTVHIYGLDTWSKLFPGRQLFAMGTFVRHTRAARDEMAACGYGAEWIEAVSAYLAVAIDRLADAGSSLAHWQPGSEFSVGTFQRFALPISWDFSEVNFTSGLTGSYEGAIGWIALVVQHCAAIGQGSPKATILNRSAIIGAPGEHDIVITDPPYYDAIPYSDCMDFFYVWLRRTLAGLTTDLDSAFQQPLGPKWSHDQRDGELIDDASRHDGNASRSKAAYEDGMFRAFEAARNALSPAGRLVVVFAHKHPDAWETLVSAIIRAGFTVDGSWPVQTERVARSRSLSSAALSSSIWLVCKKRPEVARPGWDTKVLEEMGDHIRARLRDFWDAGIRGPDFVWAATGPAMEAFSKHPIVKKANEPGQVLTVTEFLRQVRRIVVEFVVGRVLTRDGSSEAVSGLDDVTTYYLLHRNDFRFADAPAGACILYAVSCGLEDRALTDQLDLLTKTGRKVEAFATDEDGDDQAEDADAGDEYAEEGSGSKLRLKGWQDRKRKGMGVDAEGRPAPLIDQVHRLMHLWRAGDAGKVDEYLDSRALRKNALFHQLLQALIELAPTGSEERSLLESISNHVFARGALARDQKVLPNVEAAP